jgi:hypothetical protein
MILNKRNPVRSKNMALPSNSNNNFQINSPNIDEKFLISSTAVYKKKYKQTGLTNTNFSENLKFDPVTLNANVFIDLKKKPPKSNKIQADAKYPNWFDWNYYLNIYEDLRSSGIKTQEHAYQHWINHGENEGRECMKHHSLFKQYPNLFHKYLLGLSNSELPIKYEISNETTITKKYVCSIHCYDMKNFKHYFGEYLNQFDSLFDFIVTYVEDIHNVRFEYNFTFIRMQNRGMDIGSKFVTVDFLKQKEVDYSYVFFIHSKSNELYRKRYIQPFILNLSEIRTILSEGKIDAIFNGETYMDYNWGRNYNYMYELISYLGMDSTFFNFPAGNFYIISKEICVSLFTDMKLYNCLNTFHSFDYSWVKMYYNLTGDYKAVYENYVTNNLYGNNLETKLGHAGLADCMIEHAFERLMFLICIREKKKFLICDKTKGKIVFNNEELTVSVIACHTENSTKINAVVNNVNYLASISDIIYIIDTDYFQNNNLIQTLQDAYPDACINYKLTDKKALEYINDNPDLLHMSIEEAKNHFTTCGFRESNRLHIFSGFIFVFYCENYGYCYGKWRHFFTNIATKTKYKNYILTNDSFLITKPLDEFYALVKTNQYDLISLSASNEISYHYTDFLRNYNLESMTTYINFVTTQLSIYSNFLDVIHYIEIPSYKLFNNCKCIYDAELDCSKNVHFDDDKIMHYLNELNYPIVKIKKISVPYYDLSNVPSDFDHNEYVNLYPDLKNVNDLRDHFLNHGMNEKRYYKKHQRIYIYPPLKEYLLDYVSKNPNICKIDFENYTT